MISEELTRRLAELRQKAQDFLQMVNLIEGNFDSRLGEIKNLEVKRDKIKDEVSKNQERANKVLQDASEQASQMVKQAKSMLDEAQTSKDEAKSDRDNAEKAKAEASSLLAQANQRQKEADAQYQLVEEKRKRLLAAAQ